MIDPSKREETILKNMGLVLFVVSQMETELPPLMTFEDARQCGYLGLILAVDSYDERLSGFSTYAVMKIRAAVMEGMEEYSLLNRSQRRRAAGWEKARLDLEKASGGAPAGTEEVAQYLSVSVNRGRMWERYAQAETIYLESCREIDLWRLREDEARAEDAMEAEMESDELRHAMKALAPEEKLVIEQLYFLGRSQREVQQRYGIGKNYLRDVKRIALRKMRLIMENEGVPPLSLQDAEMEEGRKRPRKTGKIQAAHA